MTLPASGNISWLNICTEFSLNPNTAVWPASFYGKGGAPASGNLSFSNFYGRTAASPFTPQPGTYDYDNNGMSTGSGASVLVTSTGGAVTWTYSKTGVSSANVTASIASGGSAASILFELPAARFASRSATVTLTQGANSWTLNLTADATG